jgi:hypothetical protein
MDFIAMLSGRIILEFLGALIRYLYFNLLILLNDNDFRTFSSFWSPKTSNKKKDENSELNHMIGVITIGSFVMLLIIFNA